MSAENDWGSVDFYGGPLDGHVDRLHRPMKPFLAVKTNAHAPDDDSIKVLVRVLLLHDHLQPFVLAIYELRGCGQTAAYHYMRSMVATDVQIDPSLVSVMCQGADQCLKLMAIDHLK